MENITLTVSFLAIKAPFLANSSELEAKQSENE